VNASKADRVYRLSTAVDLMADRVADARVSYAISRTIIQTGYGVIPEARQEHERRLMRWRRMALRRLLTALEREALS
jgi:hypothetical protein